MILAYVAIQAKSSCVIGFIRVLAMVVVLHSVAACTSKTVYWRNADPNMQPLFSMHDAQCRLYSRSNASDSVVNPGTQSKGINVSLILLQAVGNASAAADLYNLCMASKGWNRDVVIQPASIDYVSPIPVDLTADPISRAAEIAKSDCEKFFFYTHNSTMQEIYDNDIQICIRNRTDEMRNK
jgi:hypothetical protein